MNKIEGTRDYCEYLLRECECDNLYFGKNKGSIYWVEGAEAWCYLCGDTTDWGQADELLGYIDDNILLDYYNDCKEQIDEHIEEQERTNNDTI